MGLVMSSSCCNHAEKSDITDSPKERKSKAFEQSSSSVSRCHMDTKTGCRSTLNQTDGYELLYDACLVGDVNQIQCLAKSYPPALCVEDSHGHTPLDICLKRYYSLLDNEEQDLAITEMIVALIRKSPNKILCPKLEYTLGSLGPIVSSKLLSSPRIEILDLSKIHLTKDAMLSLLQQLSRNQNVLECSIPLLLIDRQICDALYNMLKQNTTLRRLTFRTRLVEKWRANMMQSSLEAVLVHNKTLITLDLLLMPQYKLRLFCETMEGNCDSKIDRSLISMHLALNRAGPLHMDTITRAHLATMLTRARSSLSAQFFLLRNAPHVLIND